MKPIERADVQDLTTYEKGRAETRVSVIRLRQTRRIQVGEKLSLVFENRATVLYQIHEMVRAERLVEEPAIAHEIETYNQILPGPLELAATLFLEVNDPGRIRADLEQFLGLDRGEYLWFELGDGGSTSRIVARFEEGHSEPGRISAVHYVRFPMTAAQASRFADLSVPLSMVALHPNYQVRVEVGTETRRSLAEDLAAH